MTAQKLVLLFSSFPMRFETLKNELLANSFFFPLFNEYTAFLQKNLFEGLDFGHCLKTRNGTRYISKGGLFCSALKSMCTGVFVGRPVSYETRKSNGHFRFFLHGTPKLRTWTRTHKHQCTWAFNTCVSVSHSVLREECKNPLGYETKFSQLMLRYFQQLHPLSHKNQNLAKTNGKYVRDATGCVGNDYNPKEHKQTLRDV